MDDKAGSRLIGMTLDLYVICDSCSRAQFLDLHIQSSLILRILLAYSKFSLLTVAPNIRHYYLFLASGVSPQSIRNQPRITFTTPNHQSVEGFK